MEDRERRRLRYINHIVVRDLRQQANKECSKFDPARNDDNSAGKGDGGIFVRDICTSIASVAGVQEHHLVLIIQEPHAIILSIGARIN